MSSKNASVFSKRQREESRQPGTTKRSRLQSSVDDDKKTCLVDDSGFSLKKIRKISGMPIMKMLKKIQTTRDERGEASDFVRRVSPLYMSATKSSLGESESTVSLITVPLFPGHGKDHQRTRTKRLAATW